MDLERIQELFEAARRLASRGNSNDASDLLTEVVVALSIQTGIPLWSHGYIDLDEDAQTAHRRDAVRRAELIAVDVADRARIKRANWRELRAARQAAA